MMMMMPPPLPAPGVAEPRGGFGAARRRQPEVGALLGPGEIGGGGEGSMGARFLPRLGCGSPHRAPPSTCSCRGPFPVPLLRAAPGGGVAGIPAGLGGLRDAPVPPAPVPAPPASALSRCRPPLCPAGSRPCVASPRPGARGSGPGMLLVRGPGAEGRASARSRLAERGTGCSSL